jgi:hypothetical protein
MAKGLRASSERANRRKLRTGVFGPVEKARADRLHAKMLEIIQSEKPAPPKNKGVDNDGTPRLHSLPKPPANSRAATAEATTDDLAKGSSLLTAAIPRSLSDDSPKPLDPAQENCQLRNLCFYLGLCSDVVGFSEQGDLTFAFDPLPPHWLSENQGLTVTP